MKEENKVCRLLHSCKRRFSLRLIEAEKINRTSHWLWIFSRLLFGLRAPSCISKNVVNARKLPANGPAEFTAQTARVFVCQGSGFVSIEEQENLHERWTRQWVEIHNKSLSWIHDQDFTSESPWRAVGSPEAWVSFRMNKVLSLKASAIMLFSKTPVVVVSSTTWTHKLLNSHPEHHWQERHHRLTTSETFSLFAHCFL